MTIDTPYDPDTTTFLRHLYREDVRENACRAQTAEELDEWQDRARPALRRLIGLEAIASSLEGHETRSALGEAVDCGAYTRRKGRLWTEPGIGIPFWLLEPLGEGPFPLAVTPHGHDYDGMNTSAGVARDGTHREKIEAEDRDVAVQAVERGFVAIAPASRGLSEVCVKDVTERHGARDCRSHLVHSLLAGRTVIGERVWDLERLVDWGTSLPNVDGSRILLTGNSGGGVQTIYGAACDARITVAVPSCSFCTFVGRNGLVHHCDCNAVPGILGFGEFYDVAGLIAPRHLLMVNGREDKLFPLSEVDRGVSEVGRIYELCGQPERFRHRYGDGGHRFYGELMWAFIEPAIGLGR